MASVTITNIETGVSSSTRTGPDGGFVIAYLLPGTYRITVQAAGFKTLERSPIQLRVNDRTRLDLTLDLGTPAERLTVTAEAPLVEAASGSRGQVIGTRELEDLPLNSKNPFTLVNLAAGVQYTGALTFFRPFDNGSINDFSINGGRTSTNEYQIDGISDTAMTGRSNSRTDLGYVPPAEATQELKIQTTSYDAQYGRTGGGVISVSVKPGTNAVHGAAYEYLRRTSFEANQFANNAAGAPARPAHPRSVRL